ncbi:MAG: ABC transporter, substrate-binding protein (cluster 1, maltose/g3p/polyamine/iron) [uncultured Arthrobacter sp.]|uniref:ABC transporter, substrate-binding protein (Cluster 1, maltose/g3p/polyamine/iron) n=1 Tax=uncultured Arthrobacter sp. TaxID=114050 RepID=A0A6J4HZX4_9MICC|nr:extracellular solute-binding protein [uncultured Arthrobacter sp.]RJU00877.1 extracellular solute-binding protein [Arthrobacter frigidicola]CAA9237634.1 MAG: ABC transporter, substrate-binding protein (cluster 1, maltose/g3p/polyamine/iron) [uncultured Arthrobacter sp.]
MRAHYGKATAAFAMVSALTLAGCAGGGGGDSTAGGEGGSSCEPSSGPVDLTFTTWVPGMDKVVDLWNEENPDIQVKVQTGPNGNSGTYQNFFNQLQAGNAPDLGQIEYDALPNFRVQDGLENIASCENVSDAEDQFVDWTWGQVTFGEDDAVYAVPQDSGPMAMFYRKDLFEQAGIEVPTTWEEYAAAAEEIKAQGSYITNFPRGDVNWFAGNVWQAGGQWFSNDDEGWDVNLTGEESEQVANYWQGLLEKDQVSTLPSFSDEWNASFNEGDQWTWISAVWGASTLATGAPDTSGKWAVAPMPQWEDGGTAAGNWGGSSTAVLKGSEHPYEAAQFALWLNTDPEALALANELGGLYPAAKSATDLEAFSGGVEYFGGQKIYDVFAEASSNVDPNFTWGPTMTQTYTDVSDGFGKAIGGDGTLMDALTSGEEATVESLKSQSIPVKE